MDRQSVFGYSQHLAQLLSNTQVTDINGTAVSLDEGAGKVVDLILSTKSNAGKIMVIGNGGSAAIASHIQNDLCKAVGVRALVFNEPPLLTALTNDHGYESAFQKSIELWADSGDLLLAISSSGRSKNILCAATTAVSHGCHVVTLSGFAADNPLRQLGHLNFYVASSVYGFVELGHSILTHFLTDAALPTYGDT